MNMSGILKCEIYIFHIITFHIILYGKILYKGIQQMIMQIKYKGKCILFPKQLFLVTVRT